MADTYRILVVHDDFSIVNIIETALKQAGYQVLSAKAEGLDHVLGLEVGADDYLVKPFYQQELLAGVKALLRRYLV